MKNKTLIAIGHNENVYVFNAIGIETIIVEEANLASVISDNIALGVKIFFISQKFRETINELRKLYEQPYPILMMLSMDEDDASIGVKDLAANVEKATGIKLF